MKLNFFARIYLAITDFRLYPFIVQKEKFIHALLYFLGFILLVTAILSTGVTVKILNWLNDAMLIYNSQVPEFTITDGILDLDKNIDISFDDIRVLGNDNYTISNVEERLGDINVKENMIILFLKDGVSVGSKDNGFRIFEYGRDLNTNKKEVYMGMEYALSSVVFKLSLAVGILCGIFVAYLISKFIHILFITVALMFLGLVFNTKHKFIDYMKVAFYVITLPIITEIIALMVIGEINTYASITYFLLMWVYMYYAIRALKLDYIIMSTQQKIMGMKFTEMNNNADNSKKEKNEDKLEEKQEEKKDEDKPEEK